MSKVDPVNIEILLRENIKKGINDAVEAVKNLDKGFEKNTDNVKRQIEIQRQLMREITGDIKNYQDQLNNAKTPEAIKEIKSNLSAAKTAMVEENGRLV